MLHETDETNSLPPGDCWLNLPTQRSGEFFALFAPISRALQRSLRAQMLDLACANPSRLGRPEDAIPLLVFCASWPCRPHPRGEFSYDLLEPVSVAKFFRLATRELGGVLARVAAAMTAAGRPDLAALYQPRYAERIMKLVHTQVRFQKLIFQILRSENALLNTLLGFSGARITTPKQRAVKSALFAKKWESVLVRFYGHRDFTPLSACLLQAATEALLRARSGAPNENVAGEPAGADLDEDAGEPLNHSA